MSWPCSAPSKEQSLVTIERVLLDFYTVLIRFYPGQFRQDFAAEMRTVFGDALGEARREGLWAMLRLCGREVRDLPSALARQHWQSARETEAGMHKNMRFTAGKGEASPEPDEMPVRSWGEIFLAMLPILLILLANALPMLLGENGLLNLDAARMQVVNIILRVLMIGAFLAVFFLAWRRKWPSWSATWVPFIAAAPLVLAGALLSWFFPERLNFLFRTETVMFLVLPLVLAVLLYTVTRSSPLRGLLAALPVLYLFWLDGVESIDNSIEITINIPGIVLVCLAIAFLLRLGNWRTGLYVVLAMNLAVGALFSYAGIHHGEMLPYLAPWRNLVELVRNLIPQYLATSAILVGALFAWKIRQAGRSGGRAGRVSYHLALAGLLLVILANLASLMLVMEAPYGISISSNRSLLAAILLGLGLYLVGLVFLYRDAPFARRAPGWAERLLLAFLPLAIPLTFSLPFISWKWPPSDLYGIPLLWVLPHAVSLSLGLVWLALSVWVVTHRTEAARPTAALEEAPEASPLS